MQVRVRGSNPRESPIPIVQFLPERDHVGAKSNQTVIYLRIIPPNLLKQQSHSARQHSNQVGKHLQLRFCEVRDYVFAILVIVEKCAKNGVVH